MKLEESLTNVGFFLMNVPLADCSVNTLAAQGSMQDIQELDEETKEVFKTFKEINQLELVRQAGIRQQCIDQSVSLNLAFPAEANPKLINQVHLDAWKKGIKTLYYMRTESVLRGDIAQKAMEECIACDG